MNFQLHFCYTVRRENHRYLTQIQMLTQALQKTKGVTRRLLVWIRSSLRGKSPNCLHNGLHPGGFRPCAPVAILINCDHYWASPQLPRTVVQNKIINQWICFYLFVCLFRFKWVFFSFNTKRISHVVERILKKHLWRSNLDLFNLHRVLPFQLVS